MIIYTTGNLLEAPVEALVNTVNTVGVMGKGIALMFKERFQDNMSEYAKACKAKEVRTGKMFVTEPGELMGPKWVVNFPTKEHWKSPSKMEWIVDGLQDLRRFIVENNVHSIAIPPLGAGNGGLDWSAVRNEIESALNDLEDVKIVIYEPTSKYQNVSKKKGVKELTPARALITELVRSYWVLGTECSLLEIQKLAWFLNKSINTYSPDNPLNLTFQANKYGPYSDSLRHLLERLDGSFLRCNKRISDAGPFEAIWFDEKKRDYLLTYLKGKEAGKYTEALKFTTELIDGFESPYGIELLATVDWLISEEGIKPNVDSIKLGLANWKGGTEAAERKSRLFDDKSIDIALQHLKELQQTPAIH